MRRILVLNERDPEHPAAGGAETHLLRLFGRLASRGFEVTWASCRFDDRIEATIEGIRVLRLGRLAQYYPRVAWFTRRKTREQRFDVVVECLNKVPFFSPLYSRAPVLVLSHHLFGEVAFQQVAWPIAAGVWTAERLIPTFYRQRPFVTISESSRDDLVSRGIPAARVEVIPCGLDVPAIEPRVSKKRGLIYVGRLEAYKRVDLLLRSLAVLDPRHDEVGLTIVGRGRAQGALERLARELGLSERIRFVGFVSDVERDTLLAESLLCLCASVKEGWGLTVLEANAVGTPVVASDSPGLRDSIRHGETGMLVPGAEPTDFAACIGRLLDEEAFVQTLSENALAWSKNFDWDRSADRLAVAIEQAAQQPWERKPISLDEGLS